MLVVYGGLLTMPVVMALPVVTAAELPTTASEHARRPKRERVVENMVMVE
jgi:hypothetical protein